MNGMYTFTVCANISTSPNVMGIFLTLGFFSVCLVFLIKHSFGTEPFRRLTAGFNRLPRQVQITVLGIAAVGIVIGGSKPESTPLRSPFINVSQLPSSASMQIVDDLAFSEQDVALRKVLSGVSIDETLDLSAPTNAIVHEPWRLRGAAENGFWVELDTPFPIRTNAYDAVYVSSSGTLAFGRRKSSSRATLLPDRNHPTSIFLAPLQTVLGIPPQARWNSITNDELGITNSLFWHDVTDSGSIRFTWRNVLLGRETNAPASFQAELFPGGDFIFRYDFSSLAPNPLSQAPDFVVGVQDQENAKTALIATAAFRCSETNHLCGAIYGLDDSGNGTNVFSVPLCVLVTNTPQFTLHWTDISDLNLSVPDPDNDGLASAEEVLVYHTDPSNPDTDFDGISDGDENALGSNPLNPDTDDDGLPDGNDPNPFVWDDAESDPGNVGMSLADQLLNGLGLAVDITLDTDGDGWPDWKEELAGTSPTHSGDSPWNEDNSTKIFDVTFSSGAALNTPVLVAVGDLRMIFATAPASRTVTLREGIAYPVTLFAAEDCTVSLTATLGSSYAVFSNPHPVFGAGTHPGNRSASSGGGTLAGGRSVPSGVIALPALSIVPDPICFHSTADKPVQVYATPDLAGTWIWNSDGAIDGATQSNVTLDYYGNDTSLWIEFFTEGAASSRYFSCYVTRCSLIDEHPHWLEHPPTDPWEPPDHYDDDYNPFTGESSFNRPPQNTGYDSGTIIAVNNDDDDASETLDFNDSNMAVPDNDLVAYYPFGRFTGQCCPCPEHQIQYAETATLIFASPNLAIWEDAKKSAAFSGTVYAGQAIYVEGLSKSSSVGADNFIWQYEDDQTYTLTDIFTVLGQRIFGDLNFDGEIDVEDKALHTTLPREFGWIMPANANAFRKVQLQTDIGLPGVFTLSLSGSGTFRVWQSANPGTNDTPVLISGQTVTNGINGISWGTSSTAGLYIQAVNGGSCILTYTFSGTGSADGIVSRASLKMTAVAPDLDVDANGDGLINEDDDLIEDTIGGIILFNCDDDLDNLAEPSVDCDDGIVNGMEDAGDLTKLLLNTVPALPEGWKLVLEISENAAERIRVYSSRAVGSTMILGKSDLTVLTRYECEPPFNAHISGVEATCFADADYDGTTIVTQKIERADGTVFASDSVKFRVAPFILSDSTRPLETVYVSNADPNFVAALKAAVGTEKVVEVSATSYSDDVWVQDEVEIGYTQTPSGGTTPVALDMPRSPTKPLVPGLEVWPQEELRGTNFGYFAKGSLRHSPNFGGNLECTPPHVKDGVEYPFGRALVSTSMESELVDFIDVQGVQAPAIALDMSWLEVGHVDEVFTFVPYGDGYKVLVADTTCALDLLEDLNVEDGGLVSGSGTNTLIATDRIWSVGQWQEGFVRIVSGTGSNQVRQVSGNTFNTLTTILPWTVQPGTNSQYQVIARSAYRCLFIEGEEDLGVVSSVTSTTLTDTTKSWPADFWKDGYVQIVSENKTTRISKILGNTSDTLDLAMDFSYAVDSTDVYVLIKNTKMWYKEGIGEYPAFETVRRVLTENTAYNVECQSRIDTALGILVPELGVTTNDVIKIPALFRKITQSGSSISRAGSFTPNMLNLLVADSLLITANPFAPKDNNGFDMFVSDVVSKLNGFSILSIDNWDFYHRNDGGVHCGTNAKRKPLPALWWERQE